MDTPSIQSEPAPHAATALVDAAREAELGARPGDRLPDVIPAPETTADAIEARQNELPPLAPTAALPSPANAAALQNTKAPDQLRAALKAQMQAVLDRDLSPRSLLELEQLAGLAQRMLIVSGDPRALNHKRGRHGQGIIGAGYGVGMGGLNPAYDAIGPDDLDGLAAPMMPASFQENFGAEAIRHMVAKDEKPKLNELFAALEIAQKIDGGEDHVKRLKAQIDERLPSGGESAPSPAGVVAVEAVGVAS